MDIKKLKTSELLDQVEDVGDDDVLFGKLINEIDARTPFAYIKERIEELEKQLEESEKEIGELRRKLKVHVHFNDKVMIGI